jgi:hypothetical protein
MRSALSRSLWLCSSLPLSGGIRSGVVQSGLSPLLVTPSLSSQNGIWMKTHRSFSQSSIVFVEVPTIEVAKAMPKSYSAMSNELIISMAIAGDQKSKEERLLREIMAVDEINYTEAQKVFAEIEKFNQTGDFMRTFPYKVGLAASVAAGFASLPLVFDLQTALWFNEAFVTTDVPDDKDLETWLEVCKKNFFSHFFIEILLNSQNAYKGWLMDMELDGTTIGATQFFTSHFGFCTKPNVKFRGRTIHTFHSKSSCLTFGAEIPQIRPKYFEGLL